MLQRIYGTASAIRPRLDDYLWRLAEAEKRDHRRLGKDWTCSACTRSWAAGLVLLAPQGGMVRHADRGLLAARAPGQRLRARLHAAHRPLLAVGDHRPPGLLQREHVRADGHRRAGLLHQADELPVPHPDLQDAICAAIATCRCAGPSWARSTATSAAGVLHGLLRVRGFTQDDAHIFCTPEQIEDESCHAHWLSACTSWRSLRLQGLQRLPGHTRPAEGRGRAGALGQAPTEALRKALEDAKLPYHVDEGGGAFYGPKIDLKIKDALGREWQMHARSSSTSTCRSAST